MMPIRRLIAVVLATGVSLALAPVAQAQNSATQTTTATGTIFQPIQLAQNSALSFGTVVRPITGGGQVYINASSGAQTADGGIAILGNGPNAGPTKASYTVTGEGGQAISVTVPANFTMTRTGGAETLQTVLTTTTLPTALDGSLGASGTAAFSIGGSMPVTASTHSGAYSGVFNVTVAYN